MGRTGTGKSSQGVKARPPGSGGHHHRAAMQVAGCGPDAGNRGTIGDEPGHFPVEDAGALEFRAPGQRQVEAVAVQLRGLFLIHSANDGG